MNDNFYELKDEVHYDKITSVEDETNDGKIDPLISRLSTYNRYETNYFSTIIENSSAAVSSFRFGYKHFPHGLVKRVSLYGRNAITSNIPEAHTTGCYLMANIYKKDGTLVSSTSSTNKLVAQFRPDSSTVVLNTWEFDNLVTPKEDEVIKFIPSPDGVTQVANYNLGILVDNYHTHEDCMCGGDGDFVNNPLASGSKWLAIAIIEGDFIHDNENQNHFTDSTKHLNSVERGVVESLYTPTNVLAWDNNYENATLGVASAKGFILSRPYITNGKFKEVRWTSQGAGSNAAVYMKITLRDTNGAPIKSYVSNNTENFGGAGLKSFRFNEEWEVDDSVSSISFEPCNADGTVRTDVQIRTRVIGNAADNNSDGSEATNANYKINVQFYKIGSVTNNFTSHVGDNTHLTNEQKTLLTEFKENKDNYIKVENQDIDYVIETGVSNNNWYRIYKSGWVEQGGVTATGSSGTTERTVTLPVELKTANYFVQLTQTGYYNSTYAMQVKNLTVTNFKVYTHNGGVQSTAAMWEAKGLRNITNDIIKANGYIPNASSWHANAYVANNLTITRVENEVGYNGDTKSITMQTSLMENGSNLMKDNTNLTSWNSDLSSLTNGSSMFKNCTNLTTVSFGENGLGSLTTATDMFYGCSLNYQSLNNILNALPSRSGTIHITVADSAQTEMVGHADFIDAEIPAYDSGNYYEYTHSSGWIVRVTSRTGFSLHVDGDTIVTDNDVSEAKGNLNATATWNSSIGQSLGITKVINEVAYN